MFRFFQNESEHLNPKVSQRSDRRGNTWWEIQNPTTGRITRVATDNEARICLEQQSY